MSIPSYDDLVKGSTNITTPEAPTSTPSYRELMESSPSPMEVFTRGEDVAEYDPTFNDYVRSFYDGVLDVAQKIETNIENPIRGLIGAQKSTRFAQEKDRVARESTRIAEAAARAGMDMPSISLGAAKFAGNLIGEGLAFGGAGGLVQGAAAKGAAIGGLSGALGRREDESALTTAGRAALGAGAGAAGGAIASRIGRALKKSPEESLNKAASEISLFKDLPDKEAFVVGKSFRNALQKNFNDAKSLVRGDSAPLYEKAGSTKLSSSVLQRLQDAHPEYMNRLVKKAKELGYQGKDLRSIKALHDAQTKVIQSADLTTDSIKYGREAVQNVLKAADPAFEAATAIEKIGIRGAKASVFGAPTGRGQSLGEQILELDDQDTIKLVGMLISNNPTKAGALRGSAETVLHSVGKSNPEVNIKLLQGYISGLKGKASNELVDSAGKYADDLDMLSKVFTNKTLVKNMQSFMASDNLKPQRELIGNFADVVQKTVNLRGGGRQAFQNLMSRHEDLTTKLFRLVSGDEVGKMLTDPKFAALIKETSKASGSDFTRGLSSILNAMDYAAVPAAAVTGSSVAETLVDENAQ